MKRIAISMVVIGWLTGCGSAPTDATSAQQGAQQGLGQGALSGSEPSSGSSGSGTVTPPGVVAGNSDGGIGTMPPPTQACKVETLGDPTSCKDPATWKSYAVDACTREGLVVQSLTLGASCGGGSTSSVTFTCCSAPPPPPPPPPPPGGCVDASIHHMSCVSSPTLVDEVTAMCNAIGLDVNTFAVADACDPTSFGGATFQCCPKKQPPPPLPL